MIRHVLYTSLLEEIRNLGCKLLVMFVINKALHLAPTQNKLCRRELLENDAFSEYSNQLAMIDRRFFGYIYIKCDLFVHFKTQYI